MDFDELINKLFDSLNESITGGDVDVRIVDSSNELLGTLEIRKNCTSCKKNDDAKKNGYIDKLIRFLVKLEKRKERKITEYDLKYIDDVLNRKALCKGCK